MLHTTDRLSYLKVRQSFDEFDGRFNTDLRVSRLGLENDAGPPGGFSVKDGPVETGRPVP